VKGGAILKGLKSKYSFPGEGWQVNSSPFLKTLRFNYSKRLHRVLLAHQPPSELAAMERSGISDRVQRPDI